MGNFLKMFLVIVFQVVAVTMVIQIDDTWTSLGIIFLQFLFLCCQLIPDRE